MAQTVLPPGFRFHPTDEEVVMHYLRRKASGRSIAEGVIGEIEIYKYEPWELPGKAILDTRDREWYFFSIPDNKYPQGSRKSRTTAKGYWKMTGKDRKVCCRNACVGMKKTLVYYTGRISDRKRTDWLMHEYRLQERGVYNLLDVVLCRVRMKGGLGPRNGEQYGAPVVDEDEEAETSSHCDAQFLGLVQEVPETTMELPLGGDCSEIGCLESNEAWEPAFDVLASQGPALDEVTLPVGVNLLPVEFEEQMKTGQVLGSRSKQLLSTIESFEDLVHPISLERGILEELLYQASGEQDGTGDLSVHLLDNLDVDHISDGLIDGFIELNDLREDLSHPTVYGMGGLGTGEPLGKEEGAVWFEACTECSTVDLGTQHDTRGGSHEADLQTIDDMAIVDGLSNQGAYFKYPSALEGIEEDDTLLDYQSTVGRYIEGERGAILSSGLALSKRSEETGEFMLMTPRAQPASVFSRLVSDVLGRAPAKPAFAAVLPADLRLLQPQVDLEGSVLQQTVSTTYSTMSFLRKRLDNFSHTKKSVVSEGLSSNPEKVAKAPNWAGMRILFRVATFLLIFACLSQGLCRLTNCALSIFEL